MGFAKFSGNDAADPDDHAAPDEQEHVPMDLDTCDGCKTPPMVCAPCDLCGCWHEVSKEMLSHIQGTSFSCEHVGQICLKKIAPVVAQTSKPAQLELSMFAR